MVSTEMASHRNHEWQIHVSMLQKIIMSQVVVFMKKGQREGRTDRQMSFNVPRFR